MGLSAVTIENLSKVFGGTVRSLSDVSFTITKGEFFTLLGPSGCGKTTLLRLIAGFEAPTTGSIAFGNLDASSLPPSRRPVNTVFQSYGLFPHMTVEANIRFGMRMLRWNAADMNARVAEMLRLVRLENLGRRMPAELSGGQRQRVALARALAPKPEVLLLDEPLSALDLKLRREMQNELRWLHQEAGITFVLVTHDQEEALAMSDRIAVMKDGRIQQIGTPDEVYENPVNAFVADFIGETNLIPAPLLGLSKGKQVALRPERIRLVAASQPSRLNATLQTMSYLGADMLYQVVLPSGETVKVRMREPLAGAAPGSGVGLTWNDDALRLLAEA